MRLLSTIGLAVCAAASQATVTFVYSQSHPAFSSLALHDDYSGVTPVGVGQSSFVSNQITYTAIAQNVGVWTGASLAGALASTDVPGFLVTADGDENFRMSPGLTVRRIGFETYTINEPGNPLSVPGAPNVSVTVVTASGSTPLSLAPPSNNHGFLGIVSDEPILSVTWFAELGRVKDTGITNMRIHEAVPEPTGIAALGLGLLAWRSRRRHRRAGSR